jgi:hypothetical protein
LDGAAKVLEVIGSIWVPPFGVAATEGFLVVDGEKAVEGFHPVEVFASFGFGFSGGVGVPGTMGADEIDLGKLEVFGEILAGDVASVGGSDKEVGLKLAGELAEDLQIFEAGVTFVADVAFVREIEIPVAMIEEGLDEGLDCALMVFQGLKAGGAVDAVAASEGDIDDDVAAIAFSDEGFEFGEKRFARSAGFIDGGKVGVEGGPVGPEAKPVETIALEVVEVGFEERVAGCEAAVIADAVEKGWIAVHGEM